MPELRLKRLDGLEDKSITFLSADDGCAADMCIQFLVDVLTVADNSLLIAWELKNWVLWREFNIKINIFVFTQVYRVRNI